MIGLAILGSTGSIGTQVLQLVDLHPDKFRVVALTAHHNAELLARQALEYKPVFVGMVDAAAAERFHDLTGIIPASGEQSLTEACSVESVDTVIVSVVGIAGLPAVMECIRLKKQIALANKEALVTGGQLVNDALDTVGMRILPVDSEHSAIFQCLQGHGSPERIILTASGGPFRTSPISQLAKMKAADALQHPKWDMGNKITIDCATMMNKGLEVIEAHWLFRLPEDQIDVLVHPQSIVHSMVEYADGSVIAQLGNPDMRIPILYALTYPERHPTDVKRLNLAEAGTLNFELPDYEKFPCLQLARDALRRGGSAPTVLNAANEVAVEYFLKDKIRFIDIPIIVERALAQMEHIVHPGIEDIFQIDLQTRDYVRGANKG